MRWPDEPVRWLRSNTQFPVRGSGAGEFSTKRFLPFWILSIALINNRREWRVKASKRVLLKTSKTSLITLDMAGMVNKTHMKGRHRPDCKMRSIHLTRTTLLSSCMINFIPNLAESYFMMAHFLAGSRVFWQMECSVWSADLWTQVGAAAVGDRSVQVSVSGSSLQHNKTSPAEDKTNAVIIPVHLSVPCHLNQALSALKLEGHSWLLKMYSPAPKKEGQTNWLPIKNLHLKYKVSKVSMYFDSLHVSDWCCETGF